MTNPTPSEFDAKLDGILYEYEQRCHRSRIDSMSEIGLTNLLLRHQAEARQAIRAAVREMVPKKHKERPYKFFSGGYESELAAYVDGFNNAIAEVLAGIGTDDRTN